METIGTKRHKRLVELLIAERKARGIRQQALARALRQQQAWISRIEGGGRRIDVIEFLAMAEAIGFDPLELLARVMAVAPDRPPRAAQRPTAAKFEKRSRPKKSRRSRHP